MAGRAGVKQLQPRLEQNAAPKCTKALKNAQNTRIFEDRECPIQIVQHIRDACISMFMFSFIVACVSFY